MKKADHSAGHLLNDIIVCEYFQTKPEKTVITYVKSCAIIQIL
jgi:hypothetical protein